ncbi:MAG: M14 family zinc carboxypeptidase [Phycisphaerales bacterium]
MADRVVFGRRTGAKGLLYAAACAVLVAASGVSARQTATPPTAPVKAESPRYAGHKFVRIDMRTASDARVIASLKLEPINCRAPRQGPTDYLVTPEQFDVIKASGLAQTVLVDDVQALIDAEWAHIQASNQQRGLNWFADYKNLDEISEYMTELANMRPELASRITLGQSLQNRDIFGLRITSGVGGPNKPGILIHGLQHAREWVTGMTAVYAADRLVRTYDSDPAIRSLLDTYEFYVVPCMNPDGYAYTWTPNNRLWRKNRRDNGDGTFGIDLNRNWGYQWGPLPQGGSSGATNSETYRGPSAFSEPETVVMSSFITAHPAMLMHVDVHSYSQLVLSAWGYTDLLPLDASMFAVVDRGITDTILATHGQVYVGGPTFTTIYPANGTSSDWSYGARNVVGWGIECRDTGQTGFLLPAAQILPNAEEVWAGIAWSAGWLRDHALYFGFPGGTPGSVPPDVAQSVQVEFGRAGRLPLTGSLRLFARVGDSGPFSQSTPGGIGGNLFDAMLPGAPCGSSVQIYLQGQTDDGQLVSYPPEGPLGPIVIPVANTAAVFADDAETDRGWTLGAAGDTATSGQWTRGNPIGTAAQPEDDHTPGAGMNCFFTGQGTAGGGVGQADVDGGLTTLISPEIDLAGRTSPRVSYWRWYSNTQGAAPNADTFRIDISNDDGGTWTNLETVGPSGPEAGGGWFFREFDVSSVITPTSSVRVRFVAEDAGAGSVVEAAVDDFAVTATADCPTGCPADVNGDMMVNSQDFFDFLGAFFADDADFNHDGMTNSQDFFDFITAFFTPC